MKFAITVCNFPDEFSCKSGACIDIYKRCDNRKDCDDGSDEEDCKLLQIPESYDKSLPPELSDEVERPNEIFIQVDVINVDIVDTVAMVVGLTVEFVLKWKDHKVNFENLQNFKNERGTVKIIPSKEKNEIWIPLPELVHDNAIIGETEVLDFFKLGVQVQNEPLPLDPGHWRETLVYQGEENILTNV